MTTAGVPAGRGISAAARAMHTGKWRARVFAGPTGKGKSRCAHRERNQQQSGHQSAAGRAVSSKEAWQQHGDRQEERTDIGRRANPESPLCSSLPRSKSQLPLNCGPGERRVVPLRGSLHLPRLWPDEFLHPFSVHFRNVQRSLRIDSHQVRQLKDLRIAPTRRNLTSVELQMENLVNVSFGSQ